MTDGAIAGTGNSRYLKSVSNFLTLYPTYADFVSALIAGTLPIDLNGINLPGWTTTGTPLNKANLLNDTTAAAINTLTGSTPGTVNEAIYKLTDFLTGRVQIHTGSYVGTGTYGASSPNSIAFDFTPTIVFLAPNTSAIYGASNNLLIFWGITTQFEYPYSSSANINPISYSGNTMSWYNETSAVDQLNTDGSTYNYVDIGFQS